MNNERELGEISTSIKNLTEAIRDIKDEHSKSMTKIEVKLDMFIKEVRENYSKKEEVTNIKKKIDYIGKTFVGSIISVVTAVIIYYVTRNWLN